MRYLRGSICVIMVYFIVSFVALASVGILADAQSSDAFPAGLLGENSMRVSITSSNGGSQFKYGAMSDFIMANSGVTILRVNDFERSMEVYVSSIDKLDGLYKVIEGEGFSESHITERRKVALVNESATIYTNYSSDEITYTHNGEEYRVIGVVKDCPYDCVLPLLSVMEAERDKPVSASFYIDGGMRTSALADTLEEIVLSCDSAALVSRDASDGSVELLDTAMLIIICSSLVLIIILCLGSVVSQWAGTRRRELFVRLLCGGEAGSAVMTIAASFLGIAVAASAAGTLAAGILMYSGVLSLNNSGISWQHALIFALISFTALAIGTIECFVILRRMAATPICELRR